MRTVQHRNIPRIHTAIAEFLHLEGDPLRLLLGRGGVMAENTLAGRQLRDQILWNPGAVARDQGVCHCKNLRRRTVVFVHHDGPSPRKAPVKLQQVFHIGTTPGIDGLVRVADDKQIPVIGAEHFHQPVLQQIDILEFIDHDVFQSLLPLQSDVFILLKNIKSKLDQVVIVQTEALFLLIQIAVEDAVLRGLCFVVFLLQGIRRHGDQIQIVFRALEEFLDFDHVPCV